MEWYLSVLKNYAVFSGRARRKEYWMFVLFNVIFTIVASIIDRVFKTSIFEILYGLAVLVPGLAVSIRRLHDIGKSGWFLLVALIPIAGPIWLLVLMCTNGEATENQYGANPKQVA
jgi:uncharacterized membrane protein YhaH (DUF805 family)